MEVQPGEANPNKPSEAQPSESTPESQISKGLYGAGLRYSDADQVPDWAKGKTADEIVQIAENLRMASINPTSPQSQEQPQAQAQAPSMNPNDIDPNLMYSDPAAYNAALKQYIAQSTQNVVSQASEPILQPLVGMARNQSMQGVHKDVWSKFGPEVDEIMTKVPLANRANPQMWDQAAEMVAGRHWRDLARAEAERTKDLNQSGTVSTGGPATQPTSSSLSPIKKLFAENSPAIQSFKNEGLNAEAVIAHAAKMGHNEAAYAEMLTKRKSMKFYERGTRREILNV